MENYVFDNQVNNKYTLLFYNSNQQSIGLKIMRINESKKRRMFIMEQIENRQSTKEKSRKSSAQRRRKIQQNLNDFVRTMSNVSYNTGGSEVFRNFKSLNQNTPNQKQLIQESEKQEKINGQLANSPSFQDINIQEDKVEVNENSKEDKVRNNISNIQNISSQELKGQQQNNQLEQQIRYPQILIQKDQKEHKISPINQANQIIENNESSASAILFTSQFNDFLNMNHQKNNLSKETPQKQECQCKQQQVIQNQQNQVNNAINSKLVTQPSQEINQKLSKSPSKSLSLQNQKQQKQINHIPDTIEQEYKEKMLLKNKSGHSLAFSNESSLKFSLYDSNIKQLLNRKLTNELVAETHHFQINQEELMAVLKLKIFVDKIQTNQWRSFYKQIIDLSKIYQFSLKAKKRQMRTYFQAFIINQQLNFQEKKNQIKCDKFVQKKEEQLRRNIFTLIKSQFFTIPMQNLKIVEHFNQKKQINLKEIIFRHFKIAWFDQKVKKQIELYYLSKLFSHFTKVIRAQKQISRNKSLSHYCQTLKRKFFKLMIEGVDKLQQQRIKNDNASWHYIFSLRKKVFEAWKQKIAYKDRYISLAMTTKNSFKQTADQKWLQIKTVDFKQIK